MYPELFDVSDTIPRARGGQNPTRYPTGEGGWEDTGGYSSIEAVPPAGTGERDFLAYLIEVVRHARAVADDGSVQMEGGHRIGATLRDIAQARAGELIAADFERVAGVSRPTAHARMELLDTLGIGRYSEAAED